MNGKNEKTRRIVDCFVGDLQRREYDPELEDRQRVMSLKPKRIYYAHGPMAGWKEKCFVVK